MPRPSQSQAEGEEAARVVTRELGSPGTIVVCYLCTVSSGPPSSSPHSRCRSFLQSHYDTDTAQRTAQQEEGGGKQV